MNTQYAVEERGRRSAGDDARERLLAGIPVTERRLQLAGVSTAVLEGGDGPPVVLLHGPGGYAAFWMRVIPDLVTTHRVVAPDLPGHGASGVPDGALDGDRAIAWLGELIERTCPSPPVVVAAPLRVAAARDRRCGGRSPDGSAGAVSGGAGDRLGALSAAVHRPGVRTMARVRLKGSRVEGRGSRV
jgi:pimeloyl-ACP methyl ester carboxylesterase